MEIKFLKTTASFLAALIILTNCTQKRIAPISSKGKTIYDRNNSFNGSKYKAFSEKFSEAGSVGGNDYSVSARPPPPRSDRGM